MALKQEKIIAVDVGANTIQMVYSNGKVIKKAVSLSFPKGVVTGMKIMVPELLTESLIAAKKKARIKKSKCVLCLSGSELIIRTIVLPIMSDEQIYKNAIHEIATYLPMDVENYSVDYMVQDTMVDEGTSQIKVMVVSIRKDILKSYVDTFKAAGLTIVRIEVFENAIEKLVRHISNKNDTLATNFGIIDIGAEKTNISTYANGRFFINKVINTGGISLTQKIADEYDIDLLSAESMKLNASLVSNDSKDEKLTEIVKEFCDQTAYEAIRIFAYYLSRNNQQAIEKVYLCGGTSMIKGFAQYQETNLRVDVIHTNDVLPEMFKTRLKFIKYGHFAAAVGATFKEVN